MKYLSFFLFFGLFHPMYAQRPASNRSLSGSPEVLFPAFQSVQNDNGIGVKSAPTLVQRGSVQDFSPIKSKIVFDPATMRSNVEIVRAANGTINWLRGELTPKSIQQHAHKSLSAQAISQITLSEWASQMQIMDANAEWKMAQATSSEDGTQHFRYHQQFQNIPIWASDVLVHLNQNGEVYAINGNYHPTPKRADVLPTISAENALEAVKNRLVAEKKWQQPDAEMAKLVNLEAPTTELMLYPQGNQMRLVYAVTLHPNLMERFTYFVDAKTNEIVHRIPKHCSLISHSVLEKITAANIQNGKFSAQHTPLNLFVKTTFEANTDTEDTEKLGSFFSASANDLNAKRQTMRVYQHDDGKYYPFWDYNNLTTFVFTNLTKGGGLTLDARNTDMTSLYRPTSDNNTWNDPALVSAHVNMATVYNYFQTRFKRNVFDDKGTTMRSVIHVTEKGKIMENAFWAGNLMAYGDGGTVFKSLAGSLDVAAHEMSHGVVEYTADLVYESQSGALNESFADVFGYFVDPEDFLMGEDIIKPNWGSGLRDLENPNSAALYADFRQPASMSMYQNMPLSEDQGGVHVNSGIPNRAAALIIKAMGKANAESIYYKSLTTYLTRNSQFVDARKALEQSAIDLFGANSTQLKQVQDAFNVVGIGTSGGTNPNNNSVTPVANGTSMIAFTTDSGQIGVWNLATDQAKLFANAFARVSSDGGDRAQLTTPRNGKKIYYVNRAGKLERINVENGAIETFNNLKLKQDGDLWNASISPDENFVTIVSGYENDANLYLYNGTKITTIALKPSTTQSGIKDDTIRYPDVVAWSPNMKVPRVAFDAYHELPAQGGDTISFWGIYEINMDSGNIDTMIPPAPEEYSIGNITYSNTNPNIVALNYIDEDGYFVFVENFSNNEELLVPIPSSITDAERPTFSPDDKKLAMVSEENASILVYDFVTKKVTSTEFDEALFTPLWFAFNATVTANEDQTMPKTDFSLQNFPNPFQASTSISFTLPQSEVISLKVYDLLGREVKTLHQGVLVSGNHQFSLSAQDMPSGVYLYQLRTTSETITQRLTIAK